MLGAKPPKKAHMNYRTYQEKLKEKKAVKDADKEKEHKGDSLKKKKKKKQKEQERKAKRKKSVPSIWPAGQVGKFRNGTLILQSRDIKKIKSSKVSK
ncbi:uncharacterized protein C1orf131 homolog [Geospiza fortis]|uniref:Uncharacterized protein C1orf131 homolog n=2 Tax=Thraupidae TaxID=400783 RepID=A0A8N5EN99_GEOFO|nr:uncharacterized protein C1orf131 homolog [Geospiza fortis]